MILAAYDSDRKYLFAAGMLAAFLCAIFSFQSLPREVVAFFDAGEGGFLPPGFAALAGNFCLLLAVWVLRPQQLGRYFYFLAWIFFLTVMVTGMVRGIANLPHSASAGRNWVDTFNALPSRLNGQVEFFGDAVTKAGIPDKVSATEMLTDPQAVASRLKEGHALIKARREVAARIVAETIAAMRASGTAPPALKNYLDSATSQGKRLDAYFVTYDTLIDEYDATLRDFSDRLGAAEARGDMLYFNVPPDKENWERHRNELERLSELTRRALEAIPVSSTQ